MEIEFNRRCTLQLLGDFKVYYVKVCTLCATLEKGSQVEDPNVKYPGNPKNIVDRKRGNLIIGSIF